MDDREDENFNKCVCCLRKLTSERSHTTYKSINGPGYGIWYNLCVECEEWCDKDMEW